MNVSDPFHFGIEDVATRPDTRTVGEALADLAVALCQQRDRAARLDFVRMTFVQEMHNGRIMGHAAAAVGTGLPNYDDPEASTPPTATDVTVWQAHFYNWAIDFYERCCNVRGWQLGQGAFERQALAFASALASLVKPLEGRCIAAGRSDRAPFLDDAGMRDPVLSEPADGSRARMLPPREPPARRDESWKWPVLPARATTVHLNAREAGPAVRRGGVNVWVR